MAHIGLLGANNRLSQRGIYLLPGCKRKVGVMEIEAKQVEGYCRWLTINCVSEIR